MSDVTIPADKARRAAYLLRMATEHRFTRDHAEYESLADLLDPPGPSLRDEVERVMRAEDANMAGYFERATDRVLAVVRRRVEALPDVVRVTDEDEMVRALFRDDVLRLLGSES